MYYEEVFRELNKKEINYFVVGGVALVLHGVVRLTADLDLMLAMDVDNLIRFINVMSKLSYLPRAPVDPEEMADPVKRRQWREEKHMTAFSFVHSREPFKVIDVLIAEPIDFAAASSRKNIIKAADIDIPIISVDDLIELKKMSGRSQDLADIEALDELRHMSEES